MASAPRRRGARLTQWQLSLAPAVFILAIFLCSSRTSALVSSPPSRRLVAEDRVQEAQQNKHTKPAETFWILLVGDSKVGKTSMLLRFLADKFDPSHQPTAGAYSKQSMIRVNGKDIRLQVWDTAGQEAFRKPVTSIYRNVQAVLVMFDPFERATFDSAQSLWLPEVKELAAPKAIKMLVSSKSDMGTPVVSLAEAQAMADQAGVPFITTSAKLNQNVTSLFQQIGLTIAALKGTAAKV